MMPEEQRIEYEPDEDTLGPAWDEATGQDEIDFEFEDDEEE